jgi:alpha-tubulin suppressor-like RCC1 family protein
VPISTCIPHLSRFLSFAIVLSLASCGGGGGGGTPGGGLGGLRAATQVTAGFGHTCAVLDNGSAKCWGYNQHGQLGLGDTSNRGDGSSEMGSALAAIDLGLGRTAVELVASFYHTCARLDNGAVKCWGDNQYGKLGVGDTSGRGDQGGEMGDNLAAVDLGTGSVAAQVTAGGQFTCARLGTGSVKCWGMGGYLGLGDTTSRGDSSNQMGDNLPAVDLGTGRTAIEIASGGNHTCARLDNGLVKCWGSSQYGQLGLGDTIFRGDGNGEMGDNLMPLDFGVGLRAVEIVAGWGFNCARLDNGSVKCWGQNNFGQLGLGDVANRGDGAGEMGDQLPAVNLGTGRTAVAVAAGTYHACAILDNGSVKCWGNNDPGELGVGDTGHRGDSAGELGDALPAVDLGTGRSAVAITAGSYDTCALLDNGAVKCWGANGYGELGLGDVFPRGHTAGQMGDSLPVVDLGS